MILSGAQLLGQRKSTLGSTTFHGINPQDGQSLPVTFHESTSGEIDDAMSLSVSAFQQYSRISNESRAIFLDRIAEEILALGEELIHRAMLETALPKGRLQGERGRTMNQLKLFASVVREGSWVDARIDTALPERQPLPRQDIRHVNIPLGPVGIFGASNFPLAFSVAGGDTASALASGCTVVVKGHPAHPGTSELVGSAILKAAAATGMPDGVFSLIQGVSHHIGGALVQHPQIKAVGFTGSYQGGKALFDLANQRHNPIPVFAEMGSTNPVFILPGAMKANGDDIAKGLANSLTLGVGQFCTNPGLVLLPDCDERTTFKHVLAETIRTISAGTMLTAGIKSAYEQHSSRLAESGINTMASGTAGATLNSVSAKVYLTDVDNLKERPELAEEVFGPSTILIESTSKDSILETARSLGGHLTATVHGTKDDLIEYAELFKILENKVGRILINGFPTGVEVCHSMVHGGPFPATTDARSTSVGTNAIKRFARPICFQNFPGILLPESLKNENPLHIWRLVNGTLTKDSME